MENVGAKTKKLIRWQAAGRRRRLGKVEGLHQDIVISGRMDGWRLYHDLMTEGERPCCTLEEMYGGLADQWAVQLIERQKELDEHRKLEGRPARRWPTAR